MPAYVILTGDGLVSRAMTCRGLDLPQEALRVVLARPWFEEQGEVEVANAEGDMEWVQTPPIEHAFTAAPGEIGVEIIPDLSALLRMMRQGEILVPRPVSPQPYVDAGEIVVPPCPAGTVITVFDVSGGEQAAKVVADTDDFEERIGFDDPGEWLVEVEAPAPHLLTSARVVIE